jgi:hypothetical protein
VKNPGVASDGLSTPCTQQNQTIVHTQAPTESQLTSPWAAWGQCKPQQQTSLSCSSRRTALPRGKNTQDRPNNSAACETWTQRGSSTRRCSYQSTRRCSSRQCFQNGPRGSAARLPRHSNALSRTASRGRTGRWGWGWHRSHAGLACARQIPSDNTRWGSRSHGRPRTGRPCRSSKRSLHTASQQHNSTTADDRASWPPPVQSHQKSTLPTRRTSMPEGRRVFTFESHSQHTNLADKWRMPAAQASH